MPDLELQREPDLIRLEAGDLERVTTDEVRGQVALTGGPKTVEERLLESIRDPLTQLAQVL